MAYSTTDRKTSCFAIGLELGPSQLNGILVNEDGKRITGNHQRLDDDKITTVISRAAALTSELAAEVPETGTGAARVAVGFQLAGMVDTRSGTVLRYRYIHDPWRSGGGYWPAMQPLASLLGNATGLPVTVESSANAYAEYQQRFGAGQEVSRFAVLLVREGVGSSLVGNTVTEGPLGLNSLTAFGYQQGYAGRSWPVGGVHGILEDIRAYTGAVFTDIEAAAALAERPDSRAAVAFEQAGRADARIIGIIMNLTQPERVILYAPDAMTDPRRKAGWKFRSGVAEFKSYRDAVNGNTGNDGTVSSDCPVVVEPLRPYDGAHGAALLALKRTFGV